MSKTGKITTIFLWALLVVSAILIISLMVNISDNDADPTMGSWINSNLVWGYILVAIGAGIEHADFLAKVICYIFFLNQAFTLDINDC